MSMVNIKFIPKLCQGRGLAVDVKRIIFLFDINEGGVSA